MSFCRKQQAWLRFLQDATSWNNTSGLSGLGFNDNAHVSELGLFYWQQLNLAG